MLVSIASSFPSSVDQLPHSDWIAVLRANGFEVERLIEVQAPPDAETHEYYAFVTADWARQWPTEDIWVARKSSR